MAESYFPFDAGPGANINETQWRDLMLANGAPSPGVIAGYENELEVFGDSTAGIVKVRAGRAGCFGHTYLNSSTLSLPVVTNATGQRRVDAVVVEFDFVNNTATTRVLAGGVAAPALTQDRGTVWQILIGYVLAPVGSPPIIAAANAVACLDRYATSNVDTPIGSGLDYYLKESAIPKGWVLARGQTHSVWQLPKIWGVLLITGHGLNVAGSEWGLDTPNEQIKIPDLRGRVTVGADNMGGSHANRISSLLGRTLGQTGGASLVALGIGDLPSHTHTVNITSGANDVAHTHTPGTAPREAFIFEVDSFSTHALRDAGNVTLPVSPGTFTGSETATHTHGVNGTTGAAGSGNSHLNMQPYAISNKIVRVA